MAWSVLEDQLDDSTGSGCAGLYRWTMDALFGSRVSPSRKYSEFAQDDTNYKPRRSVEEGVRGRSNSWNGLDPSFYKRHDLLPLEESSEESLMEPVDLHPRIPVSPPQNTDTFAARSGIRRRGESTLEFKSPSWNDPVVSKLFDKRKPTARRAQPRKNEKRNPPEIPGKFPSPKKKQAADYTSEYLEILDQLDRNGRALHEVGIDLQERQERHQNEEKSYRESYRETRAELINELKQSRKLYDNYYRLYGKYQHLKKNSKEAIESQSHVASLESQLVDLALEKEKQIHDLNRRLFQAELKAQEADAKRKRDALNYEARIAELQTQLKGRYRPSSPVSYGDQSAISEYNASVDTQFLKNLV